LARSERARPILRDEEPRELKPGISYETLPERRGVLVRERPEPAPLPSGAVQRADRRRCRRELPSRIPRLDPYGDAEEPRDSQQLVLLSRVEPG
jgi:hypothetical protein